MGLRARSPVLVGRDGELARLLTALASVRVDGSAVALVAGEAGVGKTRLIQELAARAAAERCQVCVGRCIDRGEAIWPLAPLREIVAGLVDELDHEALDLVVGSARGVLAGLVPELGDARAVNQPVGSGRLCEAVVGVFTRLARRVPLVVVFEDLHWADTTTQVLFSTLTRAGRRCPLLLVGTFRSDELHRRHPFRPVLAEIERHGRCDRIDVAPLDRAATNELIAAVWGKPPDRNEVEDVHRRSAGNPFFVEELLAARASGVGGLSTTLRDVILARAAALDHAALEVLGVAAAAGATYPEVLADACGFAAPVMKTTLGELFETALLVPDGDEVRFRHELGREVFYDELIPGERASVHARLAESLEHRRPDRLGEIARHWSAAHDSRRALVASVAAGRQALGMGAAPEAEGHFGRALELWDSVADAEASAGVDHPGLLAETATAAEHARHYDRAIELNHRAVTELTDPIREAAIWLQLRDLYRFLHRWGECAHTVTRALALIPEVPPSGMRAEALANAGLGEIFADHASEAVNLARQAIAVAEAADDHNIVVKAYDVLVHALGLAGEPEAALAVARVNLTRCGPDISPERTVSAYNALTGAMTDAGRWDEIPQYAQRAVELARKTGLGGARAVWIAERWVQSQVLLGRWADAEQVVTDLADVLEQSAADSELAGSWGVALIRQGRLDEARPLIELTRTALSGGVWNEGVGWLAAAVVMFDAAEGRHGDAAALVDAVIARPEPSPSDNTYLVATAIAALADSATAGGTQRGVTRQRDAVRATKWLQWSEATEHAGRKPIVEQQLYRRQALAELQRLGGQSTPQTWAQLAAGWERLGFRYHEAAARFRHAEALLAGTTGRGAAARRAATPELTAAQGIAEELRAIPLLTEIEDLARRARLPLATTPQRDVPAEPHQMTHALNLTPRELEVLARLGLGRSNGQIAKELFISTKTASVHVSNILRKLDVTNRVEAGAVARRYPQT